MIRPLMRGVLVLALAATPGVAQPGLLLARAQIPSGYRPLADAPASSPALDRRVTVDATPRSRIALLGLIAQQATLSFVADPSLPGMTTVHAVRGVTAMPAREALQRVLEGSSLRALVNDAGQIVIVPDAHSAAARGLPADQPAPRVRVSGYIRSRASGEVVRRAQLSADDGAVRGESNDDGFYSLLLAPGPHRLRIRAIGFAPRDTSVTLAASVTRDLLLDAREVVLGTVTVTATPTDDDDRPDISPRTTSMSIVRLDLAAVKLLPPVLGEPDPIRSLTLLPGVSQSSDASTAFSVRGGGADQNLFLLDDATIYNPSHILGFLSTFNTDAIDNVTLYKGAIPPRFGGRLSSVVDVRQREGNANEFVGSASIGLLSSRATIEGPVRGHRGSYMLAARRSYADVLTRASSDSSIRNTTAYFYDVNAKGNLKLGQSGALLVSGYLGRDKLGTRDFGAGWGNRAGTVRWNQAIGGRLFSKVTAAFGTYDYLLNLSLSTRDRLGWNSRIRTLESRIDEAWYVSPGSKIEFGVSLSDQYVDPGTVTPQTATTRFTPFRIASREGVSLAAYVGHELEVTDRLSVHYGLRYAGLHRVGAAMVYRYANDAPVVYNAALARYEPGVVLDSTSYRSGAGIRSYGGFEPRLSTRWLLGEATSVKASYARTQQFLLLASNTNSITPLDVWEPVGSFIKPLVSDQVAIGFNRNANGIELSIEAYTKRSRNVVDFIDGAAVLLNPRVESMIVQGQGRAYGLELLARRTTGRTTGWVSYTLSRAEQRFPLTQVSGSGATAGIDGGRWYPTAFDKTHNLSVVAMRPLGRKWTLGSTFLLSSGLPTTFPASRYVVDGLVITEYGPRNAGRLPLYHRLDLSATRQFKRGELQLGVLNVYNHYNAQALRFRQRVNDAFATEAVQTSIFGAVPSISYSFHF